MGILNKSLLIYLCSFIAIGWLFLAQARVLQAASDPLVLDFETGDWSGWNKECKYSYSCQIVTSPVRRGNYAARFEVRYGDWRYGDSRSEVARYGKYDTMGSDYWYGFSVYVYPSWQDSDYRSVLAQWHGTRDNGEVSRSPPLSLRFIDGDFWVRIIHSSERIQTSNDGTNVYPYISNEYAQKGVWHDFIFHVKWSYQSDGYLEVWIDGNQVVDYHGPVGYNDDRGPYFKMGIYRSTKIEHTYIAYHDEYRKGSSYEEVDPNQGTPPPTSTPTPTPTPTSTSTPIPTPTLDPRYKEVTPDTAGVTASSDDGNIPGNTVDNNLGTRWSAQGDGQWIEYDLGSNKTIGYLMIAVYNGDQRRNNFELQVSSDRGNWQTVWSGQSSGVTLEQEIYDFVDIEGRYVRYSGHMNNINTWNSLTEVDIYALPLSLGERLKTVLSNWLTSVGDQNSDGKVNSLDWVSTVAS